MHFSKSLLLLLTVMAVTVAASVVTITAALTTQMYVKSYMNLFSHLQKKVVFTRTHTHNAGEEEERKDSVFTIVEHRCSNRF